MTDGREVRLAAIEVVGSSRDALQSLVDGRDLQLMRVGSDQDRYGRVVAFVRVGDSQQAIQEMLFAQGQARVAARIGDKACADILLRSERVARAARRGGPTPISPLCGRNISTGLHPRGANLHW